MLVRLFIIFEGLVRNMAQIIHICHSSALSSIIEALNGRPSALQQSGATLRPGRTWTKSLSAEVGKWRNLKSAWRTQLQNLGQIVIFHCLDVVQTSQGSGADSAPLIASV